LGEATMWTRLLRVCAPRAPVVFASAAPTPQSGLQVSYSKCHGHADILHQAARGAAQAALPALVAGTTLLPNLVRSLILAGEGKNAAVSSCHGPTDLLHQAARGTARDVLPALVAGMTLLPNLVPSLLLTGKSKNTGKSNRMPKAPNHGARPCNHVGRHRRARAAGRYKYTPRK